MYVYNVVDVLDQFNAPQRSQKPVQSPPSSIPPPPPSTSTTSPNNATAEEDAHGEAEATDELTLAFQNELMKGMEDLFKGLSAEDILSTNANNADIDGSKTQVGGGEGGGENDIKEREQAMKAIWEALLAGGEGEGVVEGAGGEGKGKEGAKVDERADKEKEKDFQETVRKTMGKLKGSESTLKVRLSFPLTSLPPLLPYSFSSLPFLFIYLSTNLPPTGSDYTHPRKPPHLRSRLRRRRPKRRRPRHHHRIHDGPVNEQRRIIRAIEGIA